MRSDPKNKPASAVFPGEDEYMSSWAQWEGAFLTGEILVALGLKTVLNRRIVAKDTDGGKKADEHDDGLPRFPAGILNTDDTTNTQLRQAYKAYLVSLWCTRCFVSSYGSSC